VALRRSLGVVAIPLAKTLITLGASLQGGCQRFIAGAATTMPVAGGLLLGIRLRFHNHAPQQLAIRLPFHQQAADQLGGDLLGGAGEERLREGLGERAGDGSGSGRCSVLRLEQTKMRGLGKRKLSDSRFSSAKPAASLKAKVAKRPTN